MKTQLPYAMSVAAVSFVSFLVAGFTRSSLLSIAVGVILIIGGLLLVKKQQSVAHKGMIPVPKKKKA